MRRLLVGESHQVRQLGHPGVGAGRISHRVWRELEQRPRGRERVAGTTDAVRWRSRLLPGSARAGAPVVAGLVASGRALAARQMGGAGLRVAAGARRLRATTRGLLGIRGLA